MNSDRCYHIPMSDGQKMCSCKDYQMTLELTIELLCKRVVELEARLSRHQPQVLTPLSVDDRVDERHTRKHHDRRGRLIE